MNLQSVERRLNLRLEYIKLVRALDLPLPGTISASCYALGGGATSTAAGSTTVPAS